MKKFYWFTLVLLLFLLNFLKVEGQKNIKPGYIITNSADTIHGFINVKSIRSGNKYCEFYKTPDAQPEVYNPFDIYAYRIENEKFYISKRVVLNNDSTDLFLEYLVKGIVSLYYLQNKKSECYFIEKDGQIYPLSNDNIEIADNTNARNYITKSNQYKGALRYLFSNSPNLMNKINSTPYSLKQLISITEDYHNSVCSDYSCITYTKNTKINLYAEPQIGIIASWMKVDKAEQSVKDISPVIGVNFRS